MDFRVFIFLIHIFNIFRESYAKDTLLFVNAVTLITDLKVYAAYL